MILLALLACAPSDAPAPDRTRGDGTVTTPDTDTDTDADTDADADTDTDTDADTDTDSDTEPPGPAEVYWGDLHAHSGLSGDGCEDPTRQCAPRNPLPGQDFFLNAADVGLDFAAITDHAEYDGWTSLESGATLDIWSETLALVDAALPGPTIPLVGYEWTASSNDKGERTGAHRTVVLEDPAPCTAWRVPGAVVSDHKADFGHEVFTPGVGAPVRGAKALSAALAAAPTEPGCADTRWIAFLHHTALEPPVAVDWADTDLLLADEVLIEISSEHGSSECADTKAPGCDYDMNAEHFVADGSVQNGLAAGVRFGFTGGTDSHDGRPGSVQDGPSHSATFYAADGDGVVDDPRQQYADGTLTAVLLPEGSPLDRGSLFDALEARHTLVSTHRFTTLSLTVTGADGSRWLPGDVIPEAAGPLDVVIDADGLALDGVIIDAYGATETFTGTVEVGPAEARYLRFDVVVDGATERIWLSPFFGG